MPNYVLKTLYIARVLPHFQYCSPIWCNTNPAHLVLLITQQKIIIRVITNSGYFDHAQPLFKVTQILQLLDINKLHIAAFMYKPLNTEYVTTLLPQHPTRSRDRQPICSLPQHNLYLFKRSLAYSGPNIWNFVPESVKKITLYAIFKKNIHVRYRLISRKS